LNANEVSRRSDSDGSENASRKRGLTTELDLRCPKPEDGPAVTALIAASPPLDTNSAYCNLLQCSDFADTCIVAERAGKVIGWISAYRPPSRREAIFVWQVAVDASARGEGLAGRMLDELLARPAMRGATTLTTTITEQNSASWGLFTAFARRHGASLTKSPRFERDAHFAGAHDTEWQASIAPLPSAQT
jgi:L-2,4-diaminobutyric acid acetyltransferase